MTPLQKLQASVTQLEGANVLEMRSVAVAAMQHIVELVSEITSDAEMTNQLLQNEIRELSERLRMLENTSSGD